MPARHFSPPQPRPAPAAAGPATPVPTRTSRPGAAVGVPKFATAALPPLVSSTLASPGEPLDGFTRAAMESQLGHDFSAVRVHADAAAGASARSVQARAYTVGQHVAFAPGKYAPATTDGQRLLAHELVHTLQQRSAVGMTAAASPALLPPDHAAEREAAQLARGPATAPAPVSVGATGLALAREEAAPAWGSTLWTLNFAKDLIQRAHNGEGALNGMVDAHLAIEVRLKDGGTKLYTVRHPWKRIEHGGMTDSSRWVIEEVVEPKAFAGDPKITVDELGHLGDLALAIFREYRKVRWARNDPALLQKKIEQDDSLKGREEYAQWMENEVIYRNQEQLRFKASLVDQGVTVTTKLPFEDEYREAFYKGVSDDLIKNGDASKAGWAGRSAADRVVKDIIRTGKSLTHTGLTYAKHYGELWDTQREAWAQKNPELAMKRSKDRRLMAGIEALAEFVNRVDPASADADEAVQLIDSFAMLYGGAATILFVRQAEKGLERLLGPFGFRMVEGVGVGGLQQRRLEYALLNYRALEPRDRAIIRRLPHQAGKYGINTFPTQAELDAKDRLVAIRTLPDGTLHTGTLAEFRWASDNNRILHALRQLEMIRSGGPASLVGRIVDGERGAAIGAMFDTALMVRAPMNARRNVRAQMNALGSGGHVVGRDAPLVPLSSRAPARAPVPTPTSGAPSGERLGADPRSPATPKMAEGQLGPQHKALEASLRPLVENMNPWEGHSNCVALSIALDQALRTGKPQVGSARIEPIGHEPRQHRHGKFTIGIYQEMKSDRPTLEKYTGTQRKGTGGLQLIQALRQAGEGARAIVTKPGEEVGHAYNIVNRGGVLVQIDPQKRTLSLFEAEVEIMAIRNTDWAITWYLNP